MKRRGLLLRFVDIGLLLLLGFLNVTDLVQESHLAIEPPSTAPKENLPETTDLVIGQTANSSVYALSLDDGKICTAIGAEDLFSCMQEVPEKRIIILKPTATAPLQAVIDALDICKKAQRTCSW